jgi:ABC-type multidrug transport system permease subunit
LVGFIDAFGGNFAMSMLAVLFAQFTPGFFRFFLGLFLENGAA